MRACGALTRISIAKYDKSLTPAGDATDHETSVHDSKGANVRDEGRHTDIGAQPGSIVGAPVIARTKLKGVYNIEIG